MRIYSQRHAHAVFPPCGVWVSCCRLCSLEKPACSNNEAHHFRFVCLFVFKSLSLMLSYCRVRLVSAMFCFVRDGWTAWWWTTVGLCGESLSHVSAAYSPVTPPLRISLQGREGGGEGGGIHFMIWPGGWTVDYKVSLLAFYWCVHSN